MDQRVRSDSAIARRVVRSFIDFLGSVDLALGRDAEGLQIASECLTEVFGLSNQNVDEGPVLLDLFKHNNRDTEPSPSSAGASPPEPLSSNDVYREFVEGLESAAYLGSENDERAYASRLAEARFTFEETLKKCRGKNRSELLAEAFKSQGNQAMSSQHYKEAIELYTLAISVCGKNAIYFANRAAAHTQAGSYSEAVADCHRAIEIDPRYSKAYSRLGLVFYSQGRYADAVDCFAKALELDPSNILVAESLQNAQRKFYETRENQQNGVGPDEFLRNFIPQFEASPAAGDAAGSQQNDTPSTTAASDIPPFTDFVQAVMHGLTTGSDVFADNIGPEFANYVHLFGGLGQPTPRRGQGDRQAHPGSEQNREEQAPTPSQPDDPVQPSIPEDFAERVHSALQSILVVNQQEHQPPQQPQQQSPNRDQL